MLPQTAGNAPRRMESPDLNNPKSMQVTQEQAAYQHYINASNSGQINRPSSATSTFKKRQEPVPNISPPPLVNPQGL